jgi:serine/threonine protein kinase
MTIPVGQLIAGRYEVLHSLGSAGQGDVYRVRDTYENAICVLKLLNVATLTAGTWDEAQILRDLADDHILEIRNADLYAGQPYIVTALAEHGTLETELAATKGLGLDVDHVVTWMRQASMGVARAHDKSLVHNDIKPANLFLTANKECLVGDFGLASRVPPLPLVGVARGATPETAAPEVRAGWATGVPSAAFTTDVYSLGATAYWLLAAQPPVNLAGITGIPARMAAAATQTTLRLRDVAPAPCARTRRLDHRPRDGGRSSGPLPDGRRVLGGARLSLDQAPTLAPNERARGTPRLLARRAPREEQLHPVPRARRDAEAVHGHH